VRELLTELLCLADSYLRSFEGRVVIVEAERVVLDRTAFYPQGGGQPSDQGTVVFGSSVFPVSEVRREAGQVWHVLGAHSLTAANPVQGTVDWSRRYAHMRHHTALHILSAAVFRLYGGLVTGGQLHQDHARLDFDLDLLDPSRIATIQELCNQVVHEARPVRARVLPRAEALQIPDLIRTKVNLLPPDIQQIRVVEIVGFDQQADGGTHVANTREIGGIRITKTENKGRTNRRVQIELGSSPVTS
jgi:misacylated tRNA(Ala) deacylase